MPAQQLDYSPGAPDGVDSSSGAVHSNLKVNSTTGTVQVNVNGTVKTLLDDTSNQTLTGTPTFATVKVATVQDTSAINRLIPNPTAKTIVDGSATSLFEYAVASGGASGGVCFYQVVASDGTDYQTMAGMISYAAVNKAGSVTASAIGYVTGNDCKSVSAGTLTLAWTNVAGTLKATVKLQPTGSLTETTPYTVTYTVVPISGAITIL